MKRTEKTDKILVKYKQYLKLEKSLSDNTVDAYLTDLDKLLAYLTLENINILDVRLENLEDFSAGLHDIGIHPRSQARILSGIRSFYRFLIMEDYLKADPTELLESPQTGFKLPEVMTVEEIDLLIGSIDRSTKEGQRNRAIFLPFPHYGRLPESRSDRIAGIPQQTGFQTAPDSNDSSARTHLKR